MHSTFDVTVKTVTGPLVAKHIEYRNSTSENLDESKRSCYEKVLYELLLSHQR